MGRIDEFDGDMTFIRPTRKMPRIGFVIPNPQNMPVPVARPSKNLRMPPIVQPVMGQSREVTVRQEDDEDDF